jgi:hypothetical protein
MELTTYGRSTRAVLRRTRSSERCRPPVARSSSAARPSPSGWR